jgi:hypothetical protein
MPPVDNPILAPCAKGTVRKIAVDFRPQTRDMHVDHVRLRIEMIIPDVFEQHLARHRLTGIPHEVLEQAEFTRLQIELFAAALHGARQQIHLEIADGELGLRLAIRGRSKAPSRARAARALRTVCRDSRLRRPQGLRCDDLRHAAPTASAPASTRPARAGPCTTDTPSFFGNMRSSTITSKPPLSAIDWPSSPSPAISTSCSSAVSDAFRLGHVGVVLNEEYPHTLVPLSPPYSATSAATKATTRAPFHLQQQRTVGARAASVAVLRSAACARCGHRPAG